jgi:hypothetical protein
MRHTAIASASGSKERVQEAGHVLDALVSVDCSVRGTGIPIHDGLPPRELWPGVDEDEPRWRGWLRRIERHVVHGKAHDILEGTGVESER